ncbi:chloride channel protein [Leptodesmis sichuanensis]|uniref:chloride channel protein n=1 Tax=Leptodesmis sichuanensis TaxID=2906798 RepID=UPI001F1BD206|nr:chloride channel protein [Leptodesmis sichuanensis]UIE37833.1 chloride channel protein [Leptodesmis sichuanensis A121]
MKNSLPASTSPPPASDSTGLATTHAPAWFQPSPETIVLLLAFVIGGGTGLAVVGFHSLIEKVHSLLLEDLMSVISAWGFWALACIPCIGGLIVGLMRSQWKDFGLPLSALTAESQTSHRVSPIKATVKAIAASVSLGSGASLGPEGPSVEIGANIGMILGQILKVSRERQRLLLGAGAAAGLAAGFNAPIAGVFFALEVVLGTTFATSAVSVVLLSAVVAALISQIGLGGQPAFTLPSYEVRSPFELPLYLGLGLFASLVSIAYTQAIKLAQQFFQGQLKGLIWMGKIPLLLRPALGGILVGIVALQFPQVLGIGYETIEAMLRDVHFSLPLLLALLAVKLVMTAVSLGSGFVGGLFAPAMFLGASLGAAYGSALPLLPFLPFPVTHIAAPPAYAMVGMAAVLAASVRAPLTAILLLFELTRDYRIILPLMAAVGLSVWLIERLKPIVHQMPSVQPTELKVDPDQDTELLSHLLVSQAMHQNFLTLNQGLSIVEGGLALAENQAHSALVVDDHNRLTGIVTLQDINRALSAWEQSGTFLQKKNVSASPTYQTISEICTKEILTVYEDESLADAQLRMAARGLRQLPVVKRGDKTHVLGLLEQEKIAVAYSLAVTQAALQPYLLPSPVAETVPLPILQQSA